MKAINQFRSFVWFVLFSAGIMACSGPSREGIKVSGTINHPFTDELVLVEKLTGASIETVDTIEFKSNGKFIAFLKVNEAAFYRLNFFNRQFVNLILTGAETEISIEVDGDRPTGLAIVEGSRDTDLLQAINDAEDKRRSDEKLLNDEAIQARMNGDGKLFQEIVQQYQQVDAKNRTALKAEIWEAAPSLAAIFGVNYLDLETDLEFIDSLSQKFNETLADHPFTISLNDRLATIRKLAVGADAPDIALPSPDGDVVSLSSLKGNYVLIDFWAAWCRPCRAENPNVVRLYKKYQNQNFEILGVSLDRTKKAWVKAIEDDGLIWKHVSDLKYFNSQAAQTYRVDAIPATYLIGPDGKILAKGLRGESLKAKLEEIFG
ncbi:MAG: TlpA disulfide reductase family protein [Cytophagales bacterium]|nr:TlpA disulfide reductase family protein [Cytophagales bacterium]